MKLTNKQKGHILLIPVYLIVSWIFLLLVRNAIIELIKTPITEIVMWVITLTIVVISIIGVDLIESDKN